MSFTFPDPMPTDPDELAEVRAKAKEAFDEVYAAAGDAPTQDDLAQLRSITEGIAGIDQTLAEAESAEERAAEARALADALAEAEANGDDAEDTGDAADDAAAGAAEEAKADAEADTADDDGQTTETDEAAEQVAASAKPARTTFSRAATGRTPAAAPAPKSPLFLTSAAAEFTTDAVDTMRIAREVTNFAHGRAARVLAGGGRSDTTIAYLDRAVPEEFSIGDEAGAMAVLDRVTDESRLPGGSLTAAGGWCSPSETSYAFLPTAAPTGLLSLPEVTVRRGGIRFPVEPDFSQLYQDVGFHQTEAQAQAGTEKTCFEVPCGDFEEVRLEVQGICITAGVLQDKAWPELTKKYVDEALRLHQHKISARRISKIVAGSTAVTGLTGLFGTAGAVLSALELQIADMRATHRIPRGQSVEGMAPEWLLSILRADLAYRDEVLPEQVTDEHIKAHLRNIGASLQFVMDWQTDVIGGAGAPTGWPGEVQVALWPAGTWWSAVNPIINLGVTYDSTLLKTNRRIQLFTEDGVAVGKRGPESRLVTIPVTVDGMVGLRGPAAAAPAGPAA